MTDMLMDSAVRLIMTMVPYNYLSPNLRSAGPRHGQTAKTDQTRTKSRCGDGIGIAMAVRGGGEVGLKPWTPGLRLWLCKS